MHEFSNLNSIIFRIVLQFIKPPIFLKNTKKSSQRVTSLGAKYSSLLKLNSLYASAALVLFSMMYRTIIIIAIASGKQINTFCTKPEIT